MDEAAIRRVATTFFDEFVAAFGSFDGGTIARRYQSPYLALQADGTGRCFASDADIAEYFQKVVDAYYARGCRSCGYADLEVVALGERSVLATVTWDLMTEGGEVDASWRESYTLTRAGEGGAWRLPSITPRKRAPAGSRYARGA